MLEKCFRYPLKIELLLRKFQNENHYLTKLAIELQKYLCWNVPRVQFLKGLIADWTPTLTIIITIIGSMVSV